MDRARSLDGAGQLLELGGERLQFADEKTALALGDMLRGFDQRFEHHRDAWQDRLLDAFERLLEAHLLVGLRHAIQYGPVGLSLSENRH